ncbi:BTAD domain-containing putative transcriptional regulator [Amycolatopsis pithecellobii]|uniref:Transcriptional activator domain protein n=1 Tax=Amycolatopsis pithecellobii TaxID=664692 RepID=A0A6N7Z355_9PSEU|nr:BTAD domain-containing putative transcriptional regulator [Amycolatopsis pithecellobii]MTD53276.1 transcriptional activator domain protein [Amycolatopsis pithecellobii]
MIINAKLVAPDLPRAWVRRPRLATRIADVVTSGHTVWVCATAGAGKTTAVVEALSGGPVPVAWLTLDSSDQAPGRLLNYLEAALARVYPDLAGVAGCALAARTPHIDTAGLLADAIADRPVVLVLDQLERLADAPKALAIIAALARYAPRSLRLVLCSRRELTLDTPSTAAWADVIRVGEADLAFTVAEAGAALALRGGGELDAEGAVAATGGWVTGVLFEAWRSDQHVHGAGGEADPLHGYLAAHILADLNDVQREFLVRTALCDEVTVRRCEALGVPESGARLGELRRLHLPATWSAERKALRWHPRLREYLIELLDRRPAAEVLELRRRYATLLRAEGRSEEAVDLLIEIGDLDDAVLLAEETIGTVLERLDLTLANRWIAALTPHPGGSSQRLAVAELMVAVGLEHYAHGMAVSDRLVRMMGDDVRYDSDLAAMMIMCYWHAERYDDARALVGAAADGPALRVSNWANEVERIGGTAGYADEPPASGGPLDTLPLRLHWTHGRLTRLLEPQRSPWVEAVHRPWRISALVALGRLDEASALFDQAADAGLSPMFLDCFTRVELLLDLGRASEAWGEQIAGRDRVAASGSGFFKALHLVQEAKLALRLRRDPDQARAALDQAKRHPAGRAVQHVIDEHVVWQGLTFLLDHDDDEAAALLRSAAHRMAGRDRLLQLPLVGVYLAEAEWRLGNETAADDAADLALRASARLGSHHRLLSALRDFPDVVARQIDAEPGLRSEWHRLGRALLAPEHPSVVPRDRHVHLHDLGAPVLIVGEQIVRPRIAKSLELLAYLLGRPGGRATRPELLTALFDGRSDPSTRAYLRQAVNRLREVLPDPGLVRSDGDEIRLESREVSSDSRQFEYLLTAAGELPAGKQFDALRDTLDIAERGVFLDGVSSEWAEVRRRELDELVTDARMLAADAAADAGDYRTADELALAVLGSNPYREAAWQVRMRVCNALGCADALLTTYRGCEEALAEAGLEPSPGTRRLLAQLRR